VQERRVTLTAKIEKTLEKTSSFYTFVVP